MTPEVRPLVFLGTPEAAATVLEALLREGFPVVHVITRPDARRGRGSTMSPSPVKRVALEHGIDVTHDLMWLEENAELGLLGIVVAYGRIIPTHILNRVQMLNIHFSLLPRWRGAAPVERAIMAGDAITGVDIMEVEPSLDTGAVYAERQLTITDQHTTATLTDDLAELGADLLVDTLRQGLKVPVAQVGDAIYAAKITAEDLRIDWTQPSLAIVRQTRAVRAFTVVDELRLRVLEVALVEEDEIDPGLIPGHISPSGLVGTGSGCLRLIRVQPEGKAAMDATAWLRGRAPHARLHCE
jgi:methionyl-tRNA formyltransferase